MILYGSLPFDTRALREARVLSNQGYDVTVLDIDWGQGDVILSDKDKILPKFSDLS